MSTSYLQVVLFGYLVSIRNILKMAYVKEKTCRLCLNSISDKNFKLMKSVPREVLDVALMERTFDDEGNHVMCNICSIKLYAAFEFKSKCLETRKTIDGFVDVDNPSPIDLREIYAEEKGISLTDSQVCSLCMEIAYGEFTLVHKVAADILQNYIPGMIISAIKVPVICKLCMDSLHVHNCFIKSCLDVDQRFKNSVDKEDADNKTNIRHLNLCVKSEENNEREGENMKIKIEVAQINFGRAEETEEKPMQFEHIVIKSEYEEERLQSPQLRNELPESCKATRKRKRYTTDSASSIETSLTTESSTDPEVYNYVNKTQLKEEDEIPTSDQRSTGSEIESFGCEMCNFKTTWKSSLSHHMLIHKDASQIKWFKCDACDYKSKRENHLKRHKMIHTDSSEIEWHDCPMCDYKTKWKACVDRHMLKHKESSEVQWYSCDMCDHKTKRYDYLKKHMLIHKEASEILWRQCEICNYKFKSKQELIRHMLRHKDASEIQWYQCDKCGYKTKWKNLLENHMLNHKDASEIQWHECDMCDRKYKFGYTLKRHMLTHKDPSEIQWFECEICDFKHMRKHNLNIHMSVHKNHSDNMVSK